MNFTIALRYCVKCSTNDISRIARSAIGGLPFCVPRNLSKKLPEPSSRYSSTYLSEVPWLRRSGCHGKSIFWHQTRRISRNPETNSTKFRNRSTLLYFSGATILVLGLSYAAVPLYRIFCQATNYGGQVNVSQLETAKLEDMKKVSNRILTVRFNADLSSTLAWNFKPQQSEILLAPGETALAFYTATNSTDRPVTGIATYNVIPFEAGPYFNKIQCFCFEEQRLNPHEQVDMPVFFYIDPEWMNDPKLENVDTLTLSYTFFEAKEGFTLPIPSYAKH